LRRLSPDDEHDGQDELRTDRLDDPDLIVGTTAIRQHRRTSPDLLRTRSPDAIVGTPGSAADGGGLLLRCRAPEGWLRTVAAVQRLRYKQSTWR
jgi:hypothetical protein